MDILDKFIESTRRNLKEGYYDIMPAETKLKHLSLVQTIKTKKFILITEIKHASPAGEYSFDEMNVEGSATTFRESGADAISVVVEPKIFKGRIGDVPLAKKAGLPVLFKDFIIDKRQITAARNVGADAVLLIVKVTERIGLDLDDLIVFAHENKLEVLLESYDVEEMKMAVKTDADMLGINNRDLTTLKTDIRRTKEILDAVGKEKLGKPLISESGIRSAEDVAFVRNAGASGVLVGTAIWKASSIREKIAELRRGAGNE